MYCQEQAECRAGLVCRKPAHGPDGGPLDRRAYGICVPALLGRGEVCLRSDECEEGLRCSSEVGEFSDDERHGLCQPRPTLDAAARDLASGAPLDGGDLISDGGAPDQR